VQATQYLLGCPATAGDATGEAEGEPAGDAAGDGGTEVATTGFVVGEAAGLEAWQACRSCMLAIANPTKTARGKNRRRPSLPSMS
jgi:hypothetical protein